MTIPTEAVLNSSPAELGGREEGLVWLMRQRTATRLLETERPDEAAKEFRRGLADAQALLDAAHAPQAYVLVPMRIMASALGCARTRDETAFSDDDIVLTAVADLLMVANDPARDPVLRVSCVREAWRGLCAALQD